MKKLNKSIIGLLTVLILLVLSGNLSGCKIYAQVADPVPNPTPVQNVEVASSSPTPSPEIYKTDKSWVKFKYKRLIAETSERYNLDPQLIYATIMTESEGNERAYRYEPSLGEASLCMGQLGIPYRPVWDSPVSHITPVDTN